VVTVTVETVVAVAVPVGAGVCVAVVDVPVAVTVADAVPVAVPVAVAVCVALAVDGDAVVGVTYNPITDEMFAAAKGIGATLNDAPIRVSSTEALERATLLASRSETERGEWQRFRGRFAVEPCGSVAYKLARVAAGKADATFTLSPKNEWDVCSSACVIECAGGRVSYLDGSPIRYNQPTPRLAGMVASNGTLHDQILPLLRR